jgi:AcrR family transcriptional regulator
MNKRALIFNTALTLFVEHGFHGTATAKIAKEAGVANGTLFLYFPTKDQLIQELYIDIKEQLNNTILLDYDESWKLKDRFYHIFKTSINWSLDNKNEFRFIQMVHSSPYIHQIAEATLNKYVHSHLTLLEEGSQQKIIKNLPADFLLSLVSNHIFGLHQYLSNQQLEDKKRNKLINQAVELIWNMLTI